MSVELTITDITTTPSYVAEPFTQSDGVEYTFRILNSGDTDANACAFYIKELDYVGELDFPSSNGLVVDWYDILTWGESVTPTEGLLLTQDVTTTRFNLSTGASVTTAVPLTIGTGSGDTIAAGDSVDIKIQVNIPGSVSPRRLYYTLEMYYE